MVMAYQQKDPRIKIIRNTKNIGVYQNFSLGLQKIETPFFNFLCDDDILLPDFFSNALELFAKNPTSAFVAGSCLVIQEEGDILGLVPPSKNPHSSKTRVYYPPKGILQILKNGQDKIPLITSTIFRQEVIKFIGHFDVMEGLPFDMDYILRIMAQKTFSITPKPYSIMTFHQKNFTLNSYNANFQLNPTLKWKALQKMMDNILKNKQIPRQIRNKISPFYEKLIVKGILLVILNSLKSGRIGYCEEYLNLISDFLPKTKKARLFSILCQSKKNSNLLDTAIMTMKQLFFKEDKSKEHNTSNLQEYLNYYLSFH